MWSRWNNPRIVDHFVETGDCQQGFPSINGVKNPDWVHPATGSITHSQIYGSGIDTVTRGVRFILFTGGEGRLQLGWHFQLNGFTPGVYRVSVSSFVSYGAAGVAILRSIVANGGVRTEEDANTKQGLWEHLSVPMVVAPGDHTARVELVYNGGFGTNGYFDTVRIERVSPIIRGRALSHNVVANIFRVTRP